MSRRNVNSNGLDSLSERIVLILQRIPYGRVATYGQVAALAGNPQAARQVARILHSSSRRRQLPWHRVVNARGGIALPALAGRELQISLLRSEGVVVSDTGRIELEHYQWSAP